MITDANLLQQVEKYPLNIKAKKEKTTTRYYVMCQDIKKVFPFTDLIRDFKIVEYIDGNTLNLKINNLKEFGSIIDTNVKLNLVDYEVANQYEYFNMKISELPKNIWLLGKPTGTVFERNTDNDVYTARVSKNDDTQCTKTFDVSKYSSENEAYEAAKKWKIETSYRLDVTKNLIKILDDDIIEVQLTKNQVMKTNIIFLPLIQKIFICSGASGKGDIYAIASINNINFKYHKLITGFEVVDHIDGNRLNNCLENLRNTDYLMNNNNTHATEITPISRGTITKDTINGKYYITSIKVDGYPYENWFSVNEHGEETAKRLAKECKDKLYDDTKFKQVITSIDKPALMQGILAKIDKSLKLVKHGIVFDKNEYFEKINLSDDTKKEIHDYYLSHQLKYYMWLTNEQTRITQLLNDALPDDQPDPPDL